MTSPADIRIPADQLPADGRFGVGPSVVRPEAIDALAAKAGGYMGTSHRQDRVKSMVGRLREGLLELFSLPDGWEIVLGNGGTTVFWDAATFGLIEERSQHLVFGEFSSKFAKAVDAAPHLGAAEVIETLPGTAPQPKPSDVDLYALTHNETSTGVSTELRRPHGVTAAGGLVAVDATSAAGGLRWDPAQVDCYYFAPQKCFGSDGGLWIAACAPAAVERIERIAASDRWCPASIDLGIALVNSRKNQTYNTPALATIFLAVHQIEWFNSNGGLEWAATRSDTSADIMYRWAAASEYATPYVTDPAIRSNVVATIDLDEAYSADDVMAACAANGILDIGGYRKLGRNQLRVSMFPGVDPEDVRSLTSCIDYVVGAL
ncbi:MAG: phosphoserine transaminase [Acidimicrobiales bacterium]